MKIPPKPSELSYRIEPYKPEQGLGYIAVEYVKGVRTSWKPSNHADKELCQTDINNRLAVRERIYQDFFRERGKNND